MKKLFLILMLLPAICFADPTATPTETPTPTMTPVVSTSGVSTVVTVGSASTHVLDPALFPNAVTIYIVNDSDEVIYLNLVGGAAVMNSGFRLNASGGSLTIDRKETDWDTLYQIWGICSSGSKKLLVTVM